MIIAGTILIKLDHGKTKTPSGIHLPESMLVEKNIGTVIETGKMGKPDMPQEVEPGDKVVFNSKTYRKREFNLDGQDVIRIGQEDIYLISKK